MATSLIESFSPAVKVAVVAGAFVGGVFLHAFAGGSLEYQEKVLTKLSDVEAAVGLLTTKIDTQIELERLLRRRVDELETLHRRQLMARPRGSAQ